MRPVQIKYTDIRYGGRTVRVIRFPNAPQGPPTFLDEGEAGSENPNNGLPDQIRDEVIELFQNDNLPLYFDPTEMHFDNPDNFLSSHFVDDEVFVWKEEALKAQYR